MEERGRTRSNVMQTEYRLEGSSRMVQPKAERRKKTHHKAILSKRGYLTRPSILLFCLPRLHSVRERRARQGNHLERVLSELHSLPL